MKLSNYIAYDNTLMMMPNSLGRGRIWWGYDPFCTWILTRKLNVDYNFAISQYFLRKLDDDVKFFRFRSHLMDLLPFMYLDFLFWQSTLGRHKCSTEQPSSFNFQSGEGGRCCNDITRLRMLVDNPLGCVEGIVIILSKSFTFWDYYPVLKS
jgi:hypothetical protein